MNVCMQTTATVMPLAQTFTEHTTACAILGTAVTARTAPTLTSVQQTLMTATIMLLVQIPKVHLLVLAIMVTVEMEHTA